MGTRKARDRFSARRVSGRRLGLHLAASVLAVVLVHGFFSAQVETTGAEAVRLAAGVEGWRSGDAPLVRVLARAGGALGDRPAGWRLPTVILWAGVPLLMAGAAAGLGGRPAAIRAAWLCSAVPLSHLWGIFVGPAVLLALGFAGASWLLVGLVRARAGGGSPLPFAIGLAVLAGVAVAGVLLPGALSDGHVAEVLPPGRLPFVLLVLAAGGNPWVWAALVARVAGRKARDPAQAALLLLGGAGLGLFGLAAVAFRVDPVLAATALVPIGVALSAWTGFGEWQAVIAFTGALFSAALLLVLVTGVPGFPAEADPTARLRGWGAATEDVTVWCRSVDGSAGPRVLAEQAVAARLVLTAPACAPVGRLAEGGPNPSPPAAAPDADGDAAQGDARLVLVVHQGEIPPLPPRCEAGPHGAPVGPVGLDLVVRPSRCR